MRRLGKLVLCCVLVLAMGMTCAFAEVNQEILSSIETEWGEAMFVPRSLMKESIGFDLGSFYGLMPFCFDDGWIFIYAPDAEDEFVYLWEATEVGEYGPDVIAAAILTMYAGSDVPGLFFGLRPDKIEFVAYLPGLATVDDIEAVVGEIEGVEFVHTAVELSMRVLLY